MRDLLVVAIILGSAPFCFISPYIGVLMWYWVTYFNPHRFTWSFAYDFPVALVVAVPTLFGTIFAKKNYRSLLVTESVLLFALWIWFVTTYIYAYLTPYFAAHIETATYELSHITKILLMTAVTILIINTRERFRGVMLVTALSLGLLALKGSIFGIRTGGEFRVWGPPDSFLADNNAFGLALNMALPLLYFLTRDVQNKWLRRLLYLCFFASILSVILTYSRGGLLALLAVLAAIAYRSKHRLLGVGALVMGGFIVVAFASGAWMDRMGRLFHGEVDASGEQRLVAWETTWRFAQDYPITGGGFDTLPDVNVFQRYQPRPLPLGFLSTAPHSIYFQLLGDHGFVGLFLFLLLIGSCFLSLYRIGRAARRIPDGQWLMYYAWMIQISILAFMTAGAFLGFVYLDVIYEMIGAVVILKVLYAGEVGRQTEKPAAESSTSPVALMEEDEPALA
jgi:probable O-glycosylation ligase (exosortase A-associated)